MLVKGSMVTEMSGSLGGITAARNKGGLYFRARSGTVNPNSPAQIGVRNALQALATAWTETLTQDQRDAWTVYATNVTTTNALGDVKQNSGQNWYIAFNTPRVQVGLSRVDDAPAIFDLAQLNPVAIDTVFGDVKQISLDIDESQPWVNDAEAGLIVQTSRPQNPSIGFFKGPFRLAGVVLGDDTTPPTSPASVDSAFVNPDGSRVFARVRLSLADGRLSPPQIVTALATSI